MERGSPGSGREARYVLAAYAAMLAVDEVTSRVDERRGSPPPVSVRSGLHLPDDAKVQ